jgi:hypothetical protein
MDRLALPVPAQMRGKQRGEAGHINLTWQSGFAASP